MVNVSDLPLLQAAMSNTEERVRASEAAERGTLVGEYEARCGALLAEVERLRHELAHRTAAMAAEMDRCGCCRDMRPDTLMQLHCSVDCVVVCC
jgi:uncharacterized small protein (DUF1192 family)